jgi:hypothetical protein
MAKSKPKHRKFINSLPCVTCNELPPSQCSHVRRGGDDYGTGEKPDDKWTIPQCDKCHRNVDFIITRNNVDKFKELGLSLYSVSGDWGLGVKAVLEFGRSL